MNFPISPLGARNKPRLKPFFIRFNSPQGSSAPKRSLYTLQIGRGLAALAVVFYHANLIIGLPKYYGTTIADIFLIGRVGVDYFFVLSGFVMIIAHWNDLQGSPDPINFIWKRFRRLYPLLWIILVPLMILIAIAPAYSPGGDVRLWDFVSSLAILPAHRSINAEPFLVVEWTLRYEVVFYAMFLTLLLSRAVFALLAATVSVLAIASLHLPVETESFWIAPYFLLFFMGMIGGFLYKNGGVKRGRLALSAGIIIMLFCLWTVRSGIFAPIMITAIGVGAALIVTGAAIEEKGYPSKPALALVFLGDASYSLYLVHYPLLSLASKAAVQITPSANLAFWGVVLFAVLGGLLCHLFIERPLLKRLPRNIVGKAANKERL